MTDPAADSAARRDDLPTILAIGVIAYVGETLLHELVGHGGVCLALGGHITKLAPLWMNCSVASPWMVVAGPAMNLLAAALFLGLIWSPQRRGPARRTLLWLSFAFNALVASGYLMVGGVTGFGDWRVLFDGVHPAGLWRIPAVLVGLGAYFAGLALAARAYARLNGVSLGRGRRWTRTMIPAGGAAVVACGAEAFGGRADPMTLVLALGCTIFVGWTLSRLGNGGEVEPEPVPLNRGLVVVGVLVGLAFITMIGPGADLSGLRR